MPYIAQKDRSQYKDIIEKALEIISPEKDSFNQVDYLGFFIWQLMIGTGCPFDELCGDIDIRGHLILQANEARKILQEKDLPTQAGETNYLISSIVWGALGDCPLFEQAKYATRAYIHGMLMKVKDSLWRKYPQEDARASMVMGGVLGDIILEVYRRKTSIFEDEKIRVNGDIVA